MSKAIFAHYSLLYSVAQIGSSRRIQSNRAAITPPTNLIFNVIANANKNLFPKNALSNEIDEKIIDNSAQSVDGSENPRKTSSRVSQK